MAGMIDSAFFGDLYATAEMREVWSDRAMIQCWLDVEAALARAEASLGIIPDSAATEIGQQARVERIDLGEMKRELDKARHPIMPLIRCLARACEPEAAEFIHWGATTQDILDTGLVLQVYELCMDAVEARRPLREVLLEDRRVSAHLGPKDLDMLLDPARYTGLAGRFVDRVVRSS